MIGAYGSQQSKDSSEYRMQKHMSGVAYKAGHTKKNILIAIVNQKLSGLD